MADLLGELNRLAGTERLGAAGAANAWAGTTGLELVGALNAKAGTSGLEFEAACRAAAGETDPTVGGLEALRAAASWTEAAAFADATWKVNARNYSGTGDWLDEVGSLDGTLTGPTWYDTGATYDDASATSRTTVAPCFYFDSAESDSVDFSNNALFDLDHTADFSAVFGVRQWSWDSGAGVTFGKAPHAGGGSHWTFYGASANPNRHYMRIGDGTSTSSQFVDDAAQVANVVTDALVFDDTAETVTFYTYNSSGTQLGTQVVDVSGYGSMANATALKINGQLGQDFEAFGAGLWSRTLTTTELGQIASGWL